MYNPRTADSLRRLAAGYDQHHDHDDQPGRHDDKQSGPGVDRLAAALNTTTTEGK